MCLYMEPHHWVNVHQPKHEIYWLRQCSICHTIDWDSLDEEIRMRLRDGKGYTVTDGHDMAREIIAKHGVDRYPTIEATLLKLATEVGELIDAYQKPDKDWYDFAKEYADVGLTLYGLGTKCYINLEEEMLKVVSNETRKFA